MKFAVLVFPGSNCVSDMYYAIADELQEDVEYVWYGDRDLSSFDAILIPGGFSYGDYLRPGAIARFAPIMDAVQEAAAQGKFVLGVCNGFQILLEAGLLPGAMRHNESLKFRCLPAELQVVNNRTAFTTYYEKEAVISLPIAHAEGNYYCDQQTLQKLQDNEQIVFRYTNNPNGSLADIAGLINEQGNVLGMMPHPERALDKLLGSEDGRLLFTSLISSWRENHVII